MRRWKKKNIDASKKKIRYVSHKSQVRIMCQTFLFLYQMGFCVVKTLEKDTTPCVMLQLINKYWSFGFERDGTNNLPPGPIWSRLLMLKPNQMITIDVLTSPAKFRRSGTLNNVVWPAEPWKKYVMMTSSNGNIFRVTGHLCGEFTGPRWIPHTKASDAELWCFLWSAPAWTVE